MKREKDDTLDELANKKGKAFSTQDILVTIGLYRRPEEKAQLEDDFIRISGSKDSRLNLEQFKHECIRLGYSSLQAQAAFKTFDVNQSGNEQNHICIFYVYPSTFIKETHRRKLST